MKLAPPGNAAWSVADHIVDGQFCPPDAIEAALRVALHVSGARFMLAALCSPIQVFAPLTFLLSRDDPSAPTPSALRAHCGSAHDAGDLWDLVYPDGDGSIPLANAAPRLLTFQDLCNRLNAFHFLPAFLEAHLLDLRGDEPMGLVALRVSSPSLSLESNDLAQSLALVLLLIDGFDRDGLDAWVKANSLSALPDMVLASASVTMYRQRLLRESLLPLAPYERCVEQEFMEPGSGEIDPSLHHYLDVVRRLTACQKVELYYVRTALGTTLEPVAVASLNEGGEIAWTTQPAAHAVYRSGEPSVTSMTDIDVLAVPLIHRPIGAAEYRPEGVLCLCRERRRGSPFGLPEFYQATEVAQRLAILLVRHQLFKWLSEISFDADVAGSLTTSFDFPVIAALDAVVPSEHLPYDFLAARDRVAEVLEGIRRLTRARRIAVRLVSRDQRYLVPFSVSPARGDGVAAGLIPVGSPDYISASVHTCGRPLAGSQQRFKALAQEEPLDGFPDLAAFCVPLLLDGRVIGTLTATVPRRSADPLEDASARLVIAALRVKFELVRTRKLVIEAVLHPSLKLLHARHEINAARELLNPILAPQNDQARQARQVLESMPTLLHTIDDVHRQLEAAHRGVDAAPEGPKAAGLVALADLVRCQVETVTGNAHLVVFDDDMLAGAAVNSTVAQNVATALEQVLRNACASAESEIAIAISLVYHSGRPFARVHVQTTTAVSPGISGYLYQTPFQVHGQRKLHLGAFLAAAFLRTIGGLVYLVDATSGSHTILEIPLERKPTATCGAPVQPN